MGKDITIAVSSSVFQSGGNGRVRECGQRETFALSAEEEVYACQVDTGPCGDACHEKRTQDGRGPRGVVAVCVLIAWVACEVESPEHRTHNEKKTQSSQIIARSEGGAASSLHAQHAHPAY